MKKLFFALVLSVMTCSAVFSLPVWDTPVNIRENYAISTYSPAAQTDDNCAIYVWSELHNGARDIFAQKVNANGANVWPQALHLVNKPHTQDLPQIHKVHDYYIISWLDYVNNEDGDLYIQKINADGIMLWDPDGIAVTNTAGQKRRIQVVPTAPGQFAIFWEDIRLGSYSVFLQKYDANGNPSFQLSGLLFVSYSGVNPNYFVISNGTGGVYLAASNYANNTLKSKLGNYDSNLEPLWTSPLDPYPEQNQVYHFALERLNDNSLLLLTSNHSGQDEIHLNLIRISPSGTILWQNPAVFHNPDFPIFQEPVLKTDASGFIYLGLARNTNTLRQISLYKLDASGSQLWGATGISLMQEYQELTNPMIQPANDGGCYITWQRNGDYPNFETEIYAQKLNSNGSPVWIASNVLVSELPYVNILNDTHVSDNKLHIAFWGVKDDLQGIYLQILNNAGTPLLATNGAPIISKLGGQIREGYLKSISRTNDNAFFWIDTRSDYRSERLRVQLMDANGNALLTPNGKILFPSRRVAGYNLALADDNSIGIVIGYTTPGSTEIRFQIIDQNGETVFGEDGILISDASGYNAYSCYISHDNGAFYLAWAQSQFVSGSFWNRIMGQKVQNNTLQWGNGLQIAPAPDEVDQLLTGLKGRYFLYQETDLNLGYFAKIKLMHPDGTTAPGWLETGNPPCNPPANPNMTFQFMPIGELADDGILVAWSDLRNNFVSNIYAQKLSTTGEMLWNPEGIHLDINPSVATSIVPGNGGFNYYWRRDVMSPATQHQYLNRIDNNGTVQYSVPLNIATSLDLREAALAAFPNDFLIAAYKGTFNNMNYHELRCKIISPQGNMTLPSQGYLISDPENHTGSFTMTTLADFAYLAWFEQKINNAAYYYDTSDWDLLGLYIQKFEPSFVANPETETATALVSQLKNYPNPFNPITKISFALAEPSPIELNIYNLKGQKVKQLISGSYSRGTHLADWDGKDESGSDCSSGVYFYRLKAGEKVYTSRMLMLK